MGTSFDLKWKTYRHNEVHHYVLNNYIKLTIKNDEEYHLPRQDYKQLESFLTLLGRTASLQWKSVNWPKFLLPMDFKQSLKAWRFICHKKSTSDYVIIIVGTKLVKQTFKHGQDICRKRNLDGLIFV